MHAAIVGKRKAADDTNSDPIAPIYLIVWAALRTKGHVSD